MTKNMLIAALIAALAGCTTTPTAPPQLDLPAASASSATPEALSRWWTAFSDPALDKLVDEALANNLDLRAAIAWLGMGTAP